MRRLLACLALLAVAATGAGCTSAAGSGPNAPAPEVSSSNGPAANGSVSNGPAANTSGSAAAPSGKLTALPSPSLGSHLPTTLAGYYTQRLTWTKCETYFECSWLIVPADYPDPAGNRFALPVVKLAASDPGQKIGSLVLNPGGPGGSGVDYVLSARTGEFTQNVLNRFDIVGFDPRGVGSSMPSLRCMSGPQLDRYFQAGGFPVGSAQLSGLISEGKLYASQCVKNAKALLPYVGTVSTAKDMDVLRAALGESKLTFLGKSYGTYLGAAYASQFPAKVRALVLDGAITPRLSGTQLDIAQAQGFEQAFGQYVSWCAGQRGCPFGRGSSATASALPKIEALLAKATKGPLTNTLGDGQQATASMLLEGISAALYSKQDWPYLSSALTRAMGGDGTTLVEFANSLLERNTNGTYSNLSDVFMSVSCLDRAWPKSIADWQEASNQASKEAPLFGAMEVWGSLPCAYWPVAATPAVPSSAGSSSGSSKASSGSSASGSSAAPVLVVGDLHDPATPYSWAQALAKDLPGGVLLGWDGEGHTSYMEGSTCVNNAVDNYLISLKPPKSGTVCP
jgi:pimeloyl-ACP methyl ester carboxylesterase